MTRLHLASFFILLLSLSVSFSSCRSSRSAGGSTGKLVETFYVGEDGTQYFINPLSFDNAQKDEEMKADFTFRYKDEIKDSVSINFTITGADFYKSINEFAIANPTEKSMTTAVDLMFNERTNKGFVSRLTAKMPMKEFNQLISDPNWTISVTESEGQQSYSATKKTKKSLTNIRDDIFVIFR